MAKKFETLCFGRSFVVLTMIIFLSWTGFTVHAAVDSFIDLENGASCSDDFLHDDGNLYPVILLGGCSHPGVSTERAKNGTHSLKFHAASVPSNPNQNQRTEVSVDYVPRHTIKFCAFSIYIPTTFSAPAHWEYVAQWHTGQSNGPPVSMALDVGNATPTLVLQNRATTGSGQVDNQWSQALTAGQWHDIVLKIEVASGPNGVLRWWIDDVERCNYSGHVGRPEDDAVGVPCEFKIGIYRGTQPVDSIRYYDKIAEGDSYAEVNP